MKIGIIGNTEPAKSRKCKYPFRECTDVGDGFIVVGKKFTQLGAVIGYWNKTLAPWKFSMSSYNSDGEKITLDNELGIRIRRDR